MMFVVGGHSVDLCEVTFPCLEVPEASSLVHSRVVKAVMLNRIYLLASVLFQA